MATLDPVSKMLTPPDSPESAVEATAALHPPPPTPQASPAVKTPQTPPATAGEAPPQQPPVQKRAAAPQDPQAGDEVEDVPRTTHSREPPGFRLGHESQPSTSHVEPALSSSSASSPLRRAKSQAHRRGGPRTARRRPQSQALDPHHPSLPADHFATQAPPPASQCYRTTTVDARVDDGVFPAGRYAKGWDVVPYAPPGPPEMVPAPAPAPAPVGRVVVPKEVTAGSGKRRSSVSRAALRVQMHLNLEVEITLKASIRGDVLLTVL